jgi:hypothetical protein
MKKIQPYIFVIGFLVVTAGSDDKPRPDAPVVVTGQGRADASKVEEVPVNPLREAYFGDLHVHTTNALSKLPLAKNIISKELALSNSAFSTLATSIGTNSPYWS